MFGLVVVLLAFSGFGNLVPVVREEFEMQKRTPTGRKIALVRKGPVQAAAEELKATHAIGKKNISCCDCSHESNENTTEH